MFFLTSAVAHDVRVSYRDELIYTYHQTLKLLLTKLNYRGYIPTLNELQIELLRRGALEVIYALTTAPYLRTTNSKINPAIQPALYKEGLTTDPKLHSKNILEVHQGTIRSQLKKFDSVGLLDWGTAPSKVKGLMGRFQFK